MENYSKLCYNCFMIERIKRLIVGGENQEIGYAEELGSGVRNIIKYSKAYFGLNPDSLKSLTQKYYSVTKEELNDWYEF